MMNTNSKITAWYIAESSIPWIQAISFQTQWRRPSQWNKYSTTVARQACLLHSRHIILAMSLTSIWHCLHFRVLTTYISSKVDTIIQLSTIIQYLTTSKLPTTSSPPPSFFSLPSASPTQFWLGHLLDGQSLSENAVQCKIYSARLRGLHDFCPWFV